jgi:DNA-binding cell septation regulator SpoVG
MIRKLPITFLFIFVFLAQIFAGEICVTGVKSYDKDGEIRYEITINNAITINDIKLIDIGGRKLPKFPEYVSKIKRVYPQVIFVTRKASEAAANAVINHAVAPSAEYYTEYKISKFSKYNKKSNMKVLAAVTFNGALEIECKVIEGKNGPWVSWPSKKLKNGGDWEKQVIISDKKLREAVEEGLLSKYQAMSSEKEE